MRTYSPLITSSLVAVSLMLATPVALATTPILHPLLRPIISSSSSSTSSVTSPDLILSSQSSVSSSQSSASSSVVSNGWKALKPNPSNGNKLAEFCKSVSQLYTKGTTLVPDAVNADRFNHLMDVLAKGNALCGAMDFSKSSASSSVSSVWWSTSSSSSSSLKYPTPPNFSACKNLGEEKKIGNVPFCKFICGLDVKIDKCPAK